jgi:hypothetical protein
MYKRATFSDFLDAFRHAGREDQFSYQAKEALFEYLEDFEEETGEPYELDVIALCCEFQESDIDEIIEENGLDLSSCEDDDDRRELVKEFLDYRTTVVWSDGDSFLFQQF